MAYTAAFLIYSGIMPLLKMFLTIFLGFWLTRKGLFPPAASRGAAHVTMNAALPALIFANVVPAFNQQNVSAMGPLFLTAFFYMGCGAALGLIIREVCYVPRNFWQGIIVATALSNWGNLPTAIVITVTQSEPFDPTTDPTLGVSFVSIFILSYSICMWIGGAGNSLAWDYAPGVPQGEAALRRLPWREKPLATLFFRLTDTIVPRHRTIDCEKAPDAFDEDQTSVGRGLDTGNPSRQRTALGEDMQEETGNAVARSAENQHTGSGKQTSKADEQLETDPQFHLARRASGLSATSFHSLRPLDDVALHPPTLTSRSDFKPLDAPTPSKKIPTVISNMPSSNAGMQVEPAIIKFLHVIGTLFTPITMSMYISLLCALVPALKALFVRSDDGPTYLGPDGRPPLNFILETAEFVGNIAVPMALILLGSSFSRMKIPKPISKLPLPAIFAVTVSKLVLLPVIGIIFSQGMVAHGLVAKEALVERFVGMLLSGTPTAVNQLIVTQLYTKEAGDLDTLCAFLLAQYVFMFISTATITAISLALL